MPESAQRLKLVPILLVVLSLAVGWLSACGGGNINSGGHVVAGVGRHTITDVEVSHWMQTLVGGDFYELSAKHRVPAELVSDPPDYSSCVANLEAAAKKAHRPIPAPAQLLTKCRQLYQALKDQALEFLIESQWIIGLAGEEGFTVNDQEVASLFKETVAQETPKGSEFKRFLADNRRSLADELFIVKLDVLREKRSTRLRDAGRKALVALTQAGVRWTAKTSCRPGYVVNHCKQYKEGPAPTHPSAAVLLEQVAALTGRPCINRPACEE
jgi:hypothetical protein